MDIKLLLIEFTKVSKKLDTEYMSGTIDVNKWGELYEQLIKTYEKKIIDSIHKGGA